MNKKTIPAVAIIILLCAGWFFYVVFTPRTYDVIRLNKRSDTRYWQLPTGSQIAYSFIPAKGAKKSSPVIYLHGGPAAGITDLEIAVVGQLSDYGYDVYLYDQAGCGLSSRFTNIKEYTAERHLKDLESIVSHLGAEKVVLLGQSWGAILGAMFIADNATKVRKFVITAPASLQPIDTTYARLLPPDSLELRKPSFRFTEPKNIRTRAMEHWLRRFKSRLADDSEADAYATHSTNLLNKTMVCDTANAVRATGTEGYYSHYMTRLSLGGVANRREKIRTCDVPVLVMKAQCDNQPWGYTQEYLDLFRNSKMRLIKNAGHNIFIEQPEEYVKTIAEFVE